MHVTLFFLTAAMIVFVMMVFFRGTFFVEAVVPTITFFTATAHTQNLLSIR
ncbi:hypothetical protein [Metabacillus arenae]|uniref:Uncharacterized protein n=1 Tax=Metabacillus arenae TaxID=2771434 RepID=A0A926NQ03_9BACI|nr:hypothetical protein [Metabacillus arenae]MBD1381942.1 hypothetical protein [Metabacillus arenae]